jgi:uncharacterized membrane protein YgcG
MKRRFFSILAALLMIGGALAPQVAQAGVNDFTFKDFKGEYYLSRDKDGRSEMRVVETFTAEFPEFDQNKGVVRAIPSSYDGHSVSVKVKTLLRNGKTEPIYSTSTRNDHFVIETGDDAYVRGNQTYQLTYTLRDVTKDFGDHQELYWDTVGVGSSQPFGSVEATVFLDESVRELFTGETACYEGVGGSRKTCEIRNDGSEITFTSQGEIGPYENVTMVLGFKEGSFNPYRVSLWGIFRSFGIAGISIGTIVPEYLPPSGVSVLEASDIKSKGVAAAISGQIIDLAVRHKVRIIEHQGEKKKTTYQLEVLSIDELSEDDAAILRVTAGLQVGAMYTFSETDYGVGALLRGAQGKAIERMVDKGYRQSSAEGSKRKSVGMWLVSLAAFVPFGLIFIFVFVGLLQESDPMSVVLPLFVTPFITWPMFFAGMVLWGLVSAPLTERGVELQEYLKGLELYMKVAEADRLRILQGPQGVERTPVDTNDKAQMLHLYERVLPYAVLFGIEKEWAKTLEISYGDINTAPDWYSGASTFSAVTFSSSLAGFTSATSSSFTPPSSSSSSGSGFSSGGGSSGGGGGGGSFGGR